MTDLSDITHKLESSAASQQWRDVGIRHHHGFAIPLFSIHSAQSCGIGEFTDLLPLIDWCVRIGMDVIQLLPLNDTSNDNSPYNAISAFALNPLHLGLASLPNVAAHPHLQGWIKELQQDDGSSVQYSKVSEGKSLFLREYYRLEKNTILSSEACQNFFVQNHWLKGFGLFKTLKVANNWHSWESWEESIKHPTEAKLDELMEKYREEIEFRCVVQFLCFQQLESVKNYASSKKVLIKGDVPILISRDSADVWLNQSIYMLEYSAGAPPDQYSAEGQNWGFPVYNWHELEKQHYGWWRERLSVVSHLYHLFRIDHVVGFFRIWVVPPGKLGKEGKFFPEDPSLWINQGRNIMLMQLDASPMLPIGEDLGTVPPEVRQCLRELGICGTRVMRWERKWNEDQSFIPFNEYIPESMTTVSTHDSLTLELWWTRSPEEAQAYSAFKAWKYVPELTWQHRYDILWDSHHTTSLFHINLLQEYLALIPDMSWPDPEDERINVPGVISDRNWCYRIRPSIEQITCNPQLQLIMQSLVK